MKASDVLRRPIKTVTALTIAGALVMTGTGVASAAPAHATGTAVQTESSAYWHVPGLTRQVVAHYDRYVTIRHNGRYALRIPAAVAAADPAGVRAVRAAIAVANETIAESGSTTVTPMTKHGGVSTHWWGISMWLDAYATNKLEGLLWMGAGTAAVLSAMQAMGVITAPSAAITGLIAGIITIGAGAIQFCSNSKGVTFDMLWTGQPWCHGR